jgi:hypothetical protein
MWKLRNTKKKTTKSFIESCLVKRGHIYDYSLVEYVTNKVKVKIICKDHGIFEYKIIGGYKK